MSSEARKAAEVIQSQISTTAKESEANPSFCGFLITQDSTLPVFWTRDNKFLSSSKEVASCGKMFSEDNLIFLTNRRVTEVDSLTKEQTTRSLEETNVEPLIDKISDQEERANIQLIVANLEAKENTTIDLSGHKIKKTGMEVLAFVLAKKKNFRELNLSSNEIGDRGLIVLLKVLKNHPNLDSLNLSNNRIKRDGAQELGRFLEKAQALTTLDLSNNKICEVGAFALAKAIEKSRCLQSVDFSACNFQLKSVYRLIQALYINQKKGRSLRELHLTKGNAKLEDSFVCKQMQHLIDDRDWEQANWMTQYITEEELKSKALVTLAEDLICHNQTDFAEEIVLGRFRSTDKQKSRLVALLIENKIKRGNTTFVTSLLRYLNGEERKKIAHDLFRLFLEQGNLKKAQDMVWYLKRNNFEWESALLLLCEKIVAEKDFEKVQYLLSFLPEESREKQSASEKFLKIQSQNREFEMKAMHEHLSSVSHILND